MMKGTFKQLLEPISESESLDTKILAIENAEKIISAFRAELINLYDEFDQAEKALNGVLAGRKHVKSDYFSDIYQLFEDFFRDYYNDPIFLKYVFDPYESVEGFDIYSQTIHLKREKSSDKIPLISFSTGKKAFAFSRAAMLIESIEAEHKILILDEFGALLDFIRQDKLIEEINEGILSGYWGLFLVGTKSEMIRDVAVTPANVHQSTTALRMIRSLTPTRQRNAILFLADGALDDKKSYAAVIEQAMVPLISYNPRNAKIKTFLKLSPKNWRHRALGAEGIQLRNTHKHDRGSVERYNSTFKYLNGGRSIPVQGHCNVTGYTLGITILAQLSSLALVSRRSSQKICSQRILPDYIPTLQLSAKTLCVAPG